MVEKAFPYKLTQLLLRFRFGVICLVGIITLIALSPFIKNPTILIDQTSEGGKRTEDQAGLDLLEMADKFGQGELLLLVIQANDILTHDNLELIQRLTEGVSTFEGVRKVESITTVEDAVFDEYGRVSMAKLFETIPRDPAVLQEKFQVIRANPLWADILISADRTMTVITITLPPLTRGSSLAISVISEIEKLVETLAHAGITTHITGISPVLTDSATAVERDFKTFFWLTWLIMTILLYFAFRTIRGVMLPLGITMLAVGWTLGFMALSGEKISSVGAMLPSMIAIVCFSDAVHVLTHYYEHARASANRREVILSTMGNMLTACLLTSMTTAAAFATLTVSKLSNIRQLGIWSAVGIMLGYVLISLLMPVVLSFLKLPGTKVQEKYQNSLFSRFIQAALVLNQRYGSKVMVLMVMLFFLALAGLSQIRVETSMTSFLPKKAPSIEGLSVLQEKLLGFSAVELELQCPQKNEEDDPACFEEKWGLVEIVKIDKFLEQREDVGTVLAITDLFDWMYTKFEGTSDFFLDFEYVEGFVAESLFFLGQNPDSSGLSSLLSKDRMTARVSARLTIDGTGEQIQLIDDLQHFLDTEINKDIEVIITGDSTRMNDQIRSVIDSLTDSFFITLVIIFVLMIWLLRSLKAAAVSMVPNMLPVILTMGLMGYLGLSLNFATAMISAIAIGIAVDNTIHILVRYRREISGEQSIESALEQTIWSSGRALLFTSAVMASGCGLFILSNFTPIRHFGALMVLAISLAIVMDLLVLPFLIRFFRLRF